MEAGRNLFAGVYADVLRQIPPQLNQNLPAGHGAFAVEVGDLMLRMDTGIGPSAAADLNGFSQNPAQGCFQLSLDGIVRSA